MWRIRRMMAATCRKLALLTRTCDLLPEVPDRILYTHVFHLHSRHIRISYDLELALINYIYKKLVFKNHF